MELPCFHLLQLRVFLMNMHTFYFIKSTRDLHIYFNLESGIHQKTPAFSFFFPFLFNGLLIRHKIDFHCGMSFVPEWCSYCINRTARPEVYLDSRCFRARPDTQNPLHPDYKICDFQSAKKVRFQLSFLREYSKSWFKD